MQSQAWGGFQEEVAFEQSLRACEDIFQVARRRSLPGRIHSIE